MSNQIPVNKDDLEVKMYNALMVLKLNADVRALLAKTDMKALLQLDAAVDAAELVLGEAPSAFPTCCVCKCEKVYGKAGKMLPGPICRDCREAAEGLG